MKSIVPRRNFTIPYFDYDWDQYGVYVTFPGWLAALTAGALALLVGFRRTYRFSLRTLLIVTTMISLLLGFAVYASK